MTGIIDEECRDWLQGKGYLKFCRYLRRNHQHYNHQVVSDLMFWDFPVEGRKLVLNFDKSEYIKKQMLIQWIVHQPQITCLILGDQRMGKDALICHIFEEIILYCKEKGFESPRFVTLGNVRCPPFVDEKDMYFSFKKIPSGTAFKPVYIYCSEIEQVLPARDIKSPENQLFSVLEGTLAQNHQKLFGAVKLASKVDLNVIRSCNVKLFKFISPEKLNHEGVERNDMLSELGRWLLPSNVRNKQATLMVFDNNLLTADYGLPVWWDEEYSEQFKDVPIEKVWDFIETIPLLTKEVTASYINTIQTSVFQKFRKELTKDEILDRLTLSQ